VVLAEAFDLRRGERANRIRAASAPLMVLVTAVRTMLSVPPSDAIGHLRRCVDICVAERLQPNRPPHRPWSTLPPMIGLRPSGELLEHRVSGCPIRLERVARGADDLWLPLPRMMVAAL